MPAPAHPPQRAMATCDVPGCRRPARFVPWLHVPSGLLGGRFAEWVCFSHPETKERCAYCLPHARALDTPSGMKQFLDGARARLEVLLARDGLALPPASAWRLQWRHVEDLVPFDPAALAAHHSAGPSGGN